MGSRRAENCGSPQFQLSALRGLMGSLFRAVYTGTRPGVSPAIRAGKGWRGRRELAPRCSATQLGAFVVGAYGETHTHTNTTHQHTPPGVWVRVLRCVASFAFSLADDMMNVARDPAGVSASRRRRDRRLRSFWRHECMAVRMAVVTATHHSWKSHAVVGTQTEYPGVAGPVPVTEYEAPAHAVVPFSSPAVSSPVVGYVAPAPAVTYAVPAPVIGSVAPAPAVTYASPVPVIDSVAPAHSVTYAVPAPVIASVAPAHSVTYAVPAPVMFYVAPAPSVSYAAPAPVIENVSPAPVSEYIAPVPAVTFLAHSQQLRPAFSAAAVPPGVNLDAEFVVAASQVVGSLPEGEVFAVPVFHQVHHGLRAGDELLRVVTRRPTSLVDVMPSSRVHRHIMEDLGELAPSVQLLDLPVPLMVDQPVDILKIIAMLLPAVDEAGY